MSRIFGSNKIKTEEASFNLIKSNNLIKDQIFFIANNPKAMSKSKSSWHLPLM